MGKKALVISGGGSTGAFAGGVIQYLLQDKEKEYDLYVGTSTGSLLAPLSSVREIEILRQGYTNVTSKDIFSFNPFFTKGKKAGKHNYWKILLRIIMLRKTFGESHNLREFIRKYFKQKHFDKLKNSHVEVIAVVTNLTLETTEYKSSNDYSYDEFCDWLWASANVPIYMSLMKKNGFQYADGGLFQNVPIQAAIDAGATEIDVIVLDSESITPKGNFEIKNPIHFVISILRMVMKKSMRNNIEMGKLQSNNKNIDINLCFIPEVLTNNTLSFDKEKMVEWWDLGYEHAKNGGFQNYRLTKGNNLKKTI
jgi:NTE family protein|tara:strand:- start:2308 stop:3234 length:927 start_codon:yes stop_codon:yes gene_type:complete